MKKLLSLLVVASFAFSCDSDEADVVNLDVTEVTEVVELPPCEATPAGLTVSDITASGAVVSWTNNVDAIVYNVEFGPAGFSQGSGTLETVLGSTYTIMGLEIGTDYDVYVTANCGTGMSSSSTASFSTLNVVPPPVGDYNVTQITPSIFGYDTFDPNGGGVELELFGEGDSEANTFEGVAVTASQSAFDADYIAPLGFGNTATYVVETVDAVATFSADNEETFLVCGGIPIFLAASPNAVDYTDDANFDFIFIDDVDDACGQGAPEVTLNFERL